jgi:hypothetical protein
VIKKYKLKDIRYKSENVTKQLLLIPVHISRNFHQFSVLKREAYGSGFYRIFLFPCGNNNSNLRTDMAAKEEEKMKKRKLGMKKYNLR